jgi:hypothetical protein
LIGAITVPRTVWFELGRCVRVEVDRLLPMVVFVGTELTAGATIGAGATRTGPFPTPAW